MPEPKVQIVPIDPFDRISGLFVPFITQRIIEMARIMCPEVDPEQVALAYMTRLFNRDPNVGIIAMVESNGKVVGHAVATMETDGVKKWVHVGQCRADGNVGDAVKRAVEYADNWGHERGATHMTMATNRIDTAWKRRYGFEVIRHQMIRPLGTEEEEQS